MVKTTADDVDISLTRKEGVQEYLGKIKYKSAQDITDDFEVDIDKYTGAFRRNRQEPSEKDGFEYPITIRTKYKILKSFISDSQIGNLYFAQANSNMIFALSDMITRNREAYTTGDYKIGDRKPHMTGGLTEVQREILNDLGGMTFEYDNSWADVDGNKVTRNEYIDYTKDLNQGLSPSLIKKFIQRGINRS